MHVQTVGRPSSPRALAGPGVGPCKALGLPSAPHARSEGAMPCPPSARFKPFPSSGFQHCGFSAWTLVTSPERHLHPHWHHGKVGVNTDAALAPSSNTNDRKNSHPLSQPRCPSALLSPSSSGPRTALALAVSGAAPRMRQHLPSPRLRSCASPFWRPAGPRPVRQGSPLLQLARTGCALRFSSPSPAGARSPARLSAARAPARPPPLPPAALHAGAPTSPPARTPVGRAPCPRLACREVPAR